MRITRHTFFFYSLLLFFVVLLISPVLQKRLTFKWFFFQNKWGVSCLITSWMDRSGEEFRGRVDNAISFKVHELLAVNEFI